MRSSAALVILATTVVALSSAVHADVLGTCKAAVGIDNRINKDLCVSALGSYRHSEDENTWSLAKIAAIIGIRYAKNTNADIMALLAKPGTDAKMKAALGKCQELYYSIRVSFAQGHANIEQRDYARGKAKVQEAIILAHECNNVFAKIAIIPSPLVHHSWYSVHMAIICTAITNLIK
uniref:Pectinesterase inhibitor domain-containing protein n=1 Tax=Leersia perrieri TaxID=77586 RepID=A0A0D9VVW1_9ORYZ